MGDEVYIKDLYRPAKVIGMDDNDRSYLVEGESGNTIRRNISALNRDEWIDVYNAFG